MDQYWANFIIQDNENSKPWRCSIIDSCMSLDEAKKIVKGQKEHHRVLSAWIDKQSDDGTMEVVFHECYLDVVGNLKY